MEQLHNFDDFVHLSFINLKAISHQFLQFLVTEPLFTKSKKKGKEKFVRVMNDLVNLAFLIQIRFIC